MRLLNCHPTSLTIRFKGFRHNIRLVSKLLCKKRKVYVGRFAVGSLNCDYVKVQGIQWRWRQVSLPRLWSLLLNSRCSPRICSAIRRKVWTRDTAWRVGFSRFQQSSGHWSHLMSSMMFARKMATDTLTNRCRDKLWQKPCAHCFTRFFFEGH